MSEGAHILAEALARIEFKLDLLLGRMTTGPHPNMQFQASNCPVCTLPVEYQVDLQNQVVKRVCGCKTGKQPSLIPLIPAPGVVNGPAARSGRDEAPVPPPEPEDRDRRKGR